MAKKLICLALATCLVFSLAVCFAGSGEEEFVAALEEGINADTMWAAVTPVSSLIIFTFTFAFAYMIIRRVLKKGSHGKFGM